MDNGYSNLIMFPQSFGKGDSEEVQSFIEGKQIKFKNKKIK